MCLWGEGGLILSHTFLLFALLQVSHIEICQWWMGFYFPSTFAVWEIENASQLLNHQMNNDKSAFAFHFFTLFICKKTYCKQFFFYKSAKWRGFFCLFSAFVHRYSYASVLMFTSDIQKWHFLFGQLEKRKEFALHVCIWLKKGWKLYKNCRKVWINLSLNTSALWGILRGKTDSWN